MNDTITDTTEAAAPAPEDDGWEWAILEIMGKRQHAGRIREVEKFGAKMVRIDVPVIILFENDPKAPGHVDRWETRLYSAASVFSVSYTDEASVMKANRPYVSPYRIAGPVDDEDDERPF